jgi:hypothetical protein
MSQSLALSYLERSEKTSPTYKTSIEEAKVLVKQCAEPRPVGDSVREAIRRASRRLGFRSNRTKDIWYGDARRIEAEEMDRLRKGAALAQLAAAVESMEILRDRLRAIRSPLARQIVDSLDAALCALGRVPGA